MIKREMGGKRCEKKAKMRGKYLPLRYILAFFFTVAETLAVIGAVAALSYFVPYFYLIAVATQVYCVARVAASDDNPDYKVPWLLVLLTLPVVGFMLYFLFYSRKLKRKYAVRLAELKARSYTRDDGALFAALRAEDATACNQAKLICSMAEAHLFSDTVTGYFAEGEEMFAQMLRDLRGAQRFVFMEYFIIREGDLWDAILEILKEKAAAGVEVALIYDDIGCMTALPGNYARTLRRYGIHAAPFSRLRGNADSEFNNRSHRKITVIDGGIGYTGGVNLADEYVNRVQRFGHWKDGGVRLEGEAVFELTRLFLVDLGLNLSFPLPPRFEYFPACSRPEGQGYVVPFGDGPRPIYARRVSKCAIGNLIATATRTVYITTPYLIPDNEICSALENAALRGVAVHVIVPHVPDKKLVFGITRSYYPRLLAAGVRIYEYAPGFIHAKTYLADDTVAIVGTVNLDYRSLAHHFENGVWMYRTDCLAALKKDLETTLARSLPITATAVTPTLLQRMIRSVVRIFAPLL